MTPSRFRDPRAWIVLGLGTWIVVTAALRTGDANWDLRNYHLYNPFALLTPEAAGDVLPAQLQSYHPPTLDIPYYLLVTRIGSVAWLNALLALPRAVVVGLAFLVTIRLLRLRTPAELVLGAAAAAVGATGVAAWPTIATTMDESMPVACVFGALWLLLGDAPWTWRRCLAAGLLCGAAAGLKLTTAYAGAGLGVALLCVGGGLGGGGRVRRGAAFGAGCVAGAVVLAGWWWWRVYAETGNPLFPYYNAVFRSPLLPPVNAVDTRFFPTTPLQWLAYPFYWALRPFQGPAELPVRDPRFALATLGVLAMVVQAVRHPEREQRLFVVFMAAGYVLWLRQFAILRYLSVLEPLTGTAVLGAVLPLLRPGRVRLAAACLGVPLAVLSLRTMRYPDWGHTPRCAASVPCPPIQVALPPMAGGSLVLLLDPGPMAYLRVFAPRSVRFVGANNNLVRPVPGEPLQRRVQQALDGHRGEMWSLQEDGVAPEAVAATLRLYRLYQEGCAQVPSNLDDSRITACRLLRE